MNENNYWDDLLEEAINPKTTLTRFSQILEEADQDTLFAIARSPSVPVAALVQLNRDCFGTALMRAVIGNLREREEAIAKALQEISGSNDSR